MQEIKENCDCVEVPCFCKSVISDNCAQAGFIIQ